MTRADHPGEVAAAGPATARVSAWAPLHHRQFAAMWGGQFVSNIGGWMQKRDQERLDRVRELSDPARPAAVTHWLAVTPGKR